MAARREDSDSDSELAQVRQKAEDEGDPWASNEAERPSGENLLLSAKSESSGGGLTGGDDISHRVHKLTSYWYPILKWFNCDIRSIMF